ASGQEREFYIARHSDNLHQKGLKLFAVHASQSMNRYIKHDDELSPAVEGSLGESKASGDKRTYD
ncbi:MAG: hypothetical protein KF791_20350, partial [Verrucomicrobiae bacterium]|nr:hypothetical protein [Verrucomicrobiae bacterium]